MTLTSAPTALEARYPLAHALLGAWRAGYETKWIRFAAYLVLARLARGIPSPLE